MLRCNKNFICASWFVVLAIFPDSTASFDKENFIVGFNPMHLQYARNRDLASNILNVQLDAVLSKVNHLYFPFQGKESYAHANYLSLVPELVAQRNKNISEAKYQLILSLEVECNYFEDEKRCSEYVRNVSDLANTIQPNTVNTIVIDCRRTFDKMPAGTDYILWLTTRIKGIQTTFAGSKFHYKFGLIFELPDCIQAHKLASHAPVINLVDVVVFHAAFPEVVRSGKRMAKMAERMFETCPLSTNLSNVTQEVMILTTYLENYHDGLKLAYENLVDFWETINNWATQYQTKVIMLSAFDKIHADQTRQNLGWWFDAVTDWENLGIDTLDYMEKKELLEKKLGAVTVENEIVFHDLENVGEPSTVKMLNGTVVALGVVTGCLVMLLALVFVYFKHVKNRKPIYSLPKSEIREFFEGRKGSGEPNGEEMPYSIPYNKEKYELEIGSFMVEYSNILGKGAYGIVYKCMICQNGKSTPAAAKVEKDQGSEAAKRGLLAEIKTMSYVGDYENILKLLGAYTENLEKGKIIVFTELCPFGSLEEALRKIETRQVLDCSLDYYDSCISESTAFSLSTNTIEASECVLSLPDLNRLSFEIANGMAFLASKNVVHADLATRNVLLTVQKSAKISDFGLSRKTYNGSNYYKNHPDDLPWRWMAPESLRRLLFNEKTDVWAFGVTLWEIFTLGEVPYADLKWNRDFINNLENGLRLEEPTHSGNELYAIMMQSWNTDPVNRPTFQEIKSYLQKLHSSYVSVLPEMSDAEEGD